MKSPPLTSFNDDFFIGCIHQFQFGHVQARYNIYQWLSGGNNAESADAQKLGIVNSRLFESTLIPTIAHSLASLDLPTRSQL